VSEPDPVSEPDRPASVPAARVLFLCTGNSARSQIAEAMLEALAGGRASAHSAGSHPKRLHPNAVRVMATRGVDLRGRHAKHVDTFAGQRFDYVISLCDRVREVCPDFPGPPRLVHWSIPDPASGGDTDEDSYPVFEQLAAELETRLRFLLQVIDRTSADTAHTADTIGTTEPNPQPEVNTRA
jgi:protein-tyrosine-phosphatase